MKRQIIVAGEVKAKLAKIFRVTPRCVYDALHFVAPANELHRKIRCAAMESGGVDSVTLPACECWHDADGNMTQVYLSGARLIVNKNTGLLRLMDRKGREVASAKIANFSEISAFQAAAAELR